MTQMTAADVSKRNIYAEGHMKALRSIRKHRAKMVAFSLETGEDPVINDQKSPTLMHKVSTVAALSN